MVRIREITAGTASRQLPLGSHGLWRELLEREEWVLVVKEPLMSLPDCQRGRS